AMDHLRVVTDARHQQQESSVRPSGIKRQDLMFLDGGDDVVLNVAPVFPANPQVLPHQIGRAQRDRQQGRKHIGLDQPLGDGPERSVATNDDRGLGRLIDLIVAQLGRPLQKRFDAVSGGPQFRLELVCDLDAQAPSGNRVGEDHDPARLRNCEFVRLSHRAIDCGFGLTLAECRLIYKCNDLAPAHPYPWGGWAAACVIELKSTMSDTAVASINERAAEEYFRRGLEAEAQGLHEKAAEFYERALNENPDHEK